MGGAVSWNCKRQSTVALSSTEAECLSLGSASQQALWLRHFALELGLLEKGSIDIYCNDKGAVDLTKNAQFSSRTRHISARHYLIKQYCAKQEIKSPSSTFWTDNSGCTHKSHLCVKTSRIHDECWTYWLTHNENKWHFFKPDCGHFQV